MATRERPLSPHLSVYRRQITMVMSITHRVTGMALTFGAFGFAWFLLMLARGGDAAQAAMDCIGSPFGLLCTFGFSLCLVYHLLNGLRHLAWDAGFGYDIPAVYKTGWTVAVLTFVITAAIWFFAMGGV